jgi:hypothetical protein
MTNWNSCGMERSWHTLKFYPGICLEKWFSTYGSRIYYQNLSILHFNKWTLIKLITWKRVEGKLISRFHWICSLCPAITSSGVVWSDVFFLCSISVLHWKLLRNNLARFMSLLTVCKTVFTAALRLCCSLSLRLLFQLVQISLPSPHARHNARILVRAVVLFSGLHP